MLVYDPAARVSAKKILQSAIFAGLDKAKLPAGAYCGVLVLDE